MYRHTYIHVCTHTFPVAHLSDIFSHNQNGHFFFSVCIQKVVDYKFFILTVGMNTVNPVSHFTVSV